MANESVPVIDHLTPEECWNLVSGGGVGQIATAVVDRPTGEVAPDIFAVNFRVTEQRILFRVTPGIKPIDLTTRPTLAFQANGHDGEHNWSVVAHGAARRIKFTSDIQESGILDIQPVQPDEQWNYVRLDVKKIAGVRFYGAK